MPRWLAGRIFHNSGTKLVALALALLLYAHVFTSRESEITMDVPLQLQGVPEGLTWSGEMPASARVRFRGVGVDLLKLRSRVEPSRVRVDVMGARPGHFQRPLVAEDVVTAPGLGVQALEIVSPREIVLRFDQLLARRLPVRPATVGRVAAGYTVQGRVVVEPESVLVRGPAAVLSGTEHLGTEPVDLTGSSDIVTRSAAVQPPAGCVATPEAVAVRVVIERVVTRTFPLLPVEVLRSRGVQLKRLEPETGTVAVSGPASLVESLRSEDLRASIDARGLPPGGVYALMASVELRSGEAAGSVSVEPVRPEKFEVELE
ncbi:MAG: YbbR-like domain-containing protein [Candidatus Eisenbacteria bacterium]|uniref:YbbR-like domain-containing protein n=1 Tax=Eiseniibacteriota bacterium TaxID=2212470 RepID=A0A937X6B8_UNCEI|nr:YbbR-like domain-containing protein [Candidatus Eisenbacteria bacterium]